MFKPRLIGRILAISGIVLLCGLSAVQAQSPASQTAISDLYFAKDQAEQTPNALNYDVKTDGLCEFDDKTKGQFAIAAHNAAIGAYKALQKFNEHMDTIYKNEDGVCHYLCCTVAKKWDEALRKELQYTNYEFAGAAAAEKILKESKTIKATSGKDNPNINTGQLLEYVNRNAEYTDWDLDALFMRTSKTSQQLEEVAGWLQGANVGDTLKIDSDTSRAMEEKFGYSEWYKRGCQFFIKLENGFGCAQSGRQAQQPDENGKCYGTKIKAIYVNGVTTTTNVQVEVDCKGYVEDSNYAFKCTSDVSGCSGVEDFVKKVKGGDNDASDASKCKKELAKAEDLRTDFIKQRKNAAQLLDTISGNLEVNCTCKKKEINGEMESTKEIDECVANNPDFVEDNMAKDCKDVMEYQNSMAGMNAEHCIICHLFQTILKAVQNIAQKAFDALAPALAKLVGIGFALYIAYITLLAVAAPAQQKIGQYLTNLTVQGFKVAVALALLAVPGYIYRIIVTPLIDGGIDFGVTMVSQQDSLVTKANIQQLGKNFEFEGGESSYLSSKVLQNAVGAAAAFNEQAAFVPAMGRSLMCNAWVGFMDMNSLLTGSKNFTMFPRVEMLLEGAILYIFGLMIAFAVGFYMLDCALQLGIVCAMMPFFIASWPFKITKSYTKQGWSIFLNTVFNFVVMGIIINATSEILSQALATGLDKESLAVVLNSGPRAIMETVEFGGLQMAMLVICCLIALKMSSEIQNITNKLSGGLNIGVGAGLGTNLASTVTKTAIGVGTAAGVAGMAAGSKALESSGISGAVRSAVGKSQSSSGNGAGGDNEQSSRSSFGTRANENQNAEDSQSSDDDTASSEDTDGENSSAENTDEEGNNGA